jgi:energy-coupling factor transporter ATP-binding protein EcfA2
MTAAPILEVEGLAVAYGAAFAVRDLSFSVPEGGIVALVGSHGAGKTTTVQAIAGAMRPRAGRVRLAGEEVAGADCAEMVRRGVTLVPEGASYGARDRLFAAGAPLNVCDMAFGPDGCLWLVTGGRGSQSGLYRIRWEVELFFRNWKGGARVDHVHRLRNPSSLAVAVTASMLAALLSCDLQTALDQVSESLAPEMPDPILSVPPSVDGGFPPPASPPSPPPSPTRTTFAITLQIARAIAALQALVRAGHCSDRLSVRRAALKVTIDILRGARDRSRDRHLRPLLDQQRRSASLAARLSSSILCSALTTASLARRSSSSAFTASLRVVSASSLATAASSDALADLALAPSRPFSARSNAALAGASAASPARRSGSAFDLSGASSSVAKQVKNRFFGEFRNTENQIRKTFSKKKYSFLSPVRPPIIIQKNEYFKIIKVNS